MKSMYTILLGIAVLSLAACGQFKNSESSSDNIFENVNIPGNQEELSKPQEEEYAANARKVNLLLKSVGESGMIVAGSPVAEEDSTLNAIRNCRFDSNTIYPIGNRGLRSDISVRSRFVEDMYEDRPCLMAFGATQRTVDPQRKGIRTAESNENSVTVDFDEEVLADNLMTVDVLSLATSRRSETVSLSGDPNRQRPSRSIKIVDLGGKYVLADNPDETLTYSYHYRKDVSTYKVSDSRSIPQGRILEVMTWMMPFGPVVLVKDTNYDSKGKAKTTEKLNGKLL